MTDKVQKIREEIVGIINSINIFTPDEDGKNSSYEAGKLDVASKILQIIDSMQKESVSNPTPNKKMSVERWKKDCEAASFDINYRSHYGLTETRDDYFVDGVQWADENPIKMKEVDLEDSIKETLAQKYIDYTCKRHNIDPASREGQLIYYAYMHGMNQCLNQLKAQKGEKV